MSTDPRRPIVITAWSALSGLGRGREAFEHGVRTACAGPDVSGDEFPGTVELPPLGTIVPDDRDSRLLDRPTLMALTNAALLLRETQPGPVEPRRLAVVLGSALIGIDQTLAMLADSLGRARPYDVDPAVLPASVMNFTGGQVAIRFACKGPNATVTTGRGSGLAALQYARRLIAADRADVVVCGAVEDLNSRRSWLADGMRPGDTARGVPPGEGCAMFLVESAAHARTAARRPVCSLLGFAFDVAGADEVLAKPLAACATRALRTAGLRPDELAAVVPSQPDGGPFAELDALTDEWEGLRPPVWRVPWRVGDTHGASAGFQLATALSHDEAPGRAVLLLSADPDGELAACVVRLASRTDH